MLIDHFEVAAVGPLMLVGVDTRDNRPIVFERDLWSERWTGVYVTPEEAHALIEAYERKEAALFGEVGEAATEAVVKEAADAQTREACRNCGCNCKAGETA